MKFGNISRHVELRNHLGLPSRELILQAPIEEILSHAAERLRCLPNCAALKEGDPSFGLKIEDGDFSRGLFNIDGRHFQAFCIAGDEATYPDAERVAQHDAGIAEGHVPLSLSAWVHTLDHSGAAASPWATDRVTCGHCIGEGIERRKERSEAEQRTVWRMSRPHHLNPQLFCLETHIGYRHFAKVVMEEEAIAAIEGRDRDRSDEWRYCWWVHPRETVDLDLLWVPLRIDDGDYQNLMMNEAVQCRYGSVNAFVGTVVSNALSALYREEVAKKAETSPPTANPFEVAKTEGELHPDLLDDAIPF